ncbi:hypothetical protein IMSHALPRED_010304 [Imshaugia aleurites]|uniref:Pru domain-containing protein n=1 Tax=Imshaugia aleurites TaxID=172621 RepID=A0A8H3G3R8_9LECA|nr:hypothetical protein IMSHALPRED_010304 [Imshaugia aleurites]
MSISPLITFKAGICDLDTSSSVSLITPKPIPGYLYLYEEDELIHFCWRPRSAPMSQPELDLVMVPADGSFVPYYDKDTRSSPKPKSPTTGRIFVLKFQSSSTRHLFWLQSRSQHPQGDRTWFSPRDEKIGQIVDRLLQGDEVNVQEEYANISNDHGGDGDDEAMEDAGSASQGDIHGSIGSGDPFMGDPGNEGEESREGGADGGRAATMPSNDAAIAVQKFLRSMQGNQALSNQQSQPQSKIFTTLSDLLPSSTTIPVIDSADSAFVDNLLNHIPPVLLLLSQEADDISSVDPNSETAKAAIEALSLDQKKEVLRKVLRSPQFSQSLGSLTAALRDGGVPSISEALKIPVENGGFIRRGGVPLGGGEAVEAFLKGVKASVMEMDDVEEGRMDTD